MKYLVLFSWLLFATKGLTDATPDDIKDGLERTRVVNTKIMADFIRFGSIKNPGKNTVLLTLIANYLLGLFAVYAKSKDISSELLDDINYKNIKQVKQVIPLLSPQFFKYEHTQAVWSGTIFADISKRFNREFVNTLYKTFSANVRNTDFKDPELAANSINQMMDVNAVGLCSDTAILPQMIADDERFLLISTGYFEGSFLGYVSPCDTVHKDFYLSNGEKSRLLTMRVQGEHKYGKMKGFDAEILEMYFKGEALYMRVVKPKHREDFMPILSELKNPERFDEIFHNLEKSEMNIYMPVIDIHRNFDFMEYLEEYGTKVDLRTVKLEGMFENARDAYLSKSEMDIHLRINEGTIFANYSGSCPMPEKKWQTVHLNTPFIYYINTIQGIPVLGGVFHGVN